MQTEAIDSDQSWGSEPEGSEHMATVHPIRPEHAKPRRRVAEGNSLVGSLFWTLEAGDVWILSGESAFLFTDCWRRTIVREAHMLEAPAPRKQVWKDAIKTIARRWITGESALLDLYVAEKDGAELGISSDEVGGSLYAVAVDRGPLVCRKSVHFGSQKGLMLRAASPLERLRRGMSRSEILALLKQTAYGPGWVFQKLVPREDSDETQLILQIDGDIYYRELAAGETIRSDPRHTYAWDASVSHRLVRFGSVVDRLLRGGIPFQVEFEGPGRVWLSNMSFGDGYLGSAFTPSYWVFRIHAALRRALGILNPASWV